MEYSEIHDHVLSLPAKKNLNSVYIEEFIFRDWKNIHYRKTVGLSIQVHFNPHKFLKYFRKYTTIYANFTFYARKCGKAHVKP